MSHLTTHRVRLAALGTWAAIFWGLWLSGAADRYVGARTAWVVPLGAVLLALALGGVWRWGARSSHPASLRDVLLLGAMVVPVGALAVAPAASLGAFAVSRKDAARAAQALPLPRVHGPEEPANLFDVAVAGAQPAVAARLGLQEGSPVTLRGLVSANRDDGTFDLSRLVTFCCAADALAYTVPVEGGLADPDDPFPADTWLQISGTLERTDTGFGLRATSVTEVDPPDDPYSAAS